MENKLFVWVYLPNQTNPVLCGRLLGYKKIGFEYDAAYISCIDSLSISPDLPLKKGVFVPQGGADIHSIFEDAMPDSWGKRIWRSVYPDVPATPINLLQFGNHNRFGALAFSEKEKDNNKLSDNVFDLYHAAEAIICDKKVNDKERGLLQRGMGTGGAQPKAIYRDDENIEWLAKFEFQKNEKKTILEYHALELAQEHGLNVPCHKLLQRKDFKDILLVQRFDRSKDRRIQAITAKTLFAAYGVFDDNDKSYPLLADIIKRFSTEPKKQCLELYRRMLLNIAIDNTDDHEKNHAFVQNNNHWDLSPLYDVHSQQSKTGSQSLIVGKDGADSTFDNALSDCERFMITKKEAEKEVGYINQLMDIAPVIVVQ